MLHIPAFQSVHTECDVRSLLSSACFLICFGLSLEFGLFHNMYNKNVHSDFNSVQIEVVIDFFSLSCFFLFVKVFLHMNVITSMSGIL